MACCHSTLVCFHFQNIDYELATFFLPFRATGLLFGIILILLIQMKSSRMDPRRSESPDDYYKAVHQLRQFLSESDSSDQQIYRTESKVI